MHHRAVVPMPRHASDSEHGKTWSLDLQGYYAHIRVYFASTTHLVRHHSMLKILSMLQVVATSTRRDRSITSKRRDYVIHS